MKQLILAAIIAALFTGCATTNLTPQAVLKTASDALTINEPFAYTEAYAATVISMTIAQANKDDKAPQRAAAILSMISSLANGSAPTPETLKGTLNSKMTDPRDTAMVDAFNNLYAKIGPAIGNNPALALKYLRDISAGGNDALRLYNVTPQP